jgi:hypothetical protein
MSIAEHGGIRAKKWDSLHAAISISDLAHFEIRWELMEAVMTGEVDSGAIRDVNDNVAIESDNGQQSIDNWIA